MTIKTYHAHRHATPLKFPKLFFDFTEHIFDFTEYIFEFTEYIFEFTEYILNLPNIFR